MLPESPESRLLFFHSEVQLIRDAVRHELKCRVESLIKPRLQLIQIPHNDLLRRRFGVELFRIDLKTLQHILDQGAACRNDQHTILHAEIGFDDCLLFWLEP